MPIVTGGNHLSYNMKNENELFDDVKLVGFVRSDEDVKEAIEERLSGVDSSPSIWKRLSGKECNKKEGETTMDADTTKPVTNGHVNGAFHVTEPESCYCSDRVIHNGADAHKSNGNTHGSFSLPPADTSDGGSSHGSSWTEDTVRKCCSKKTLYKRIPILNLIANYHRGLIAPDLVAGVTVGLTMVPQSIAYASVAGLPPQYGLYSAFLGCLIYVIFGTIKVSSIGPSAISAILIRENIHGMGPSFAIFLCFMTGVVQLIMGVLQLGFLVDFISGPVTAGFTSAAAFVIAMTQVKDLLGLNFAANTFVEVWEQLSLHFHEISVGDATLGFSCMFVLLSLRKVKDIRVGPVDVKEKTAFQKYMCTFLWFLSTARNIIVVLVCGLIVYVYKEWFEIEPPFRLLAPIKAGLPHVEVPPFSSTVDNVTYNFFGMSSVVGSGLIIVPLLSLLEDVSGGKVFSNGQSIDATQELLALGTCNLVSSFVGSMSVSGGLSRGAINHASGVKTTISAVYTGVIVIISLQFLTPCFGYIPKASLAAVIVAAVVFMVEFQVVKPMWRTKKIDLIPAAATFTFSLFFRLEIGILIGVSINVLFLLYSSARPTVHVDKFKSEWGYEYIVITPDRSLSFPSVEYVRNVISKAGVKQGYSSIPVVIDSRHVHGADFTAAKGIKCLIEDFMKRNQLILFYNLKPSVVEIFRGVHPKEFHHVQTENQLHTFLKEYYFKTSNNANSIETVKRY